jgi:hypothetical protein
MGKKFTYFYLKSIKVTVIFIGFDAMIVFDYSFEVNILNLCRQIYLFDESPQSTTVITYI